MRNLSLDEIDLIQGGMDTGGYTFSQVVLSGAAGAIVGGVMGYDVVLSGCVGAGFTLAMMMAKGMDNYFFKAPVVTS